jgi:hypothetical protein
MTSILSVAIYRTRRLTGRLGMANPIARAPDKSGPKRTCGFHACHEEIKLGDEEMAIIDTRNNVPSRDCAQGAALTW